MHMNFKKKLGIAAIAMTFLTVINGRNIALAQTTPASLPAYEIAQKHGINYNKPAPGFFEGGLLGNGGMGVVVTTRPDAVVLYFGHNNVWDIRIAENNLQEIKTFKYVFDKVKALPSTLANLTDDAWYNQYNRMSGENYSKPYPRPFPCGSVVLSMDRRKVQVIGHHLDISSGVCTVNLRTADQQNLFLKMFTDTGQDRLLMELVDANGIPQNNLFERIKVIPDPSTPGEFPLHKDFEDLKSGIISFRQTLPSQPGKEKSPSNKDKAFRLTLQLNAALTKKTRINWDGNVQQMPALEGAIGTDQPFCATVNLTEGLNSLVPEEVKETERPNSSLINLVMKKNIEAWKDYWSKSAVQLSDPFLEETWYRNLSSLIVQQKVG